MINYSRIAHTETSDFFIPSKKQQQRNKVVDEHFLASVRNPNPVKEKVTLLRYETQKPHEAKIH